MCKLKIENNTVEIMGKSFSLDTVTTKKVYETVVNAKHLKFLQERQSKWNTALSQQINFSLAYNNCKIKSVDGHTRDIHFCIVHSALRVRLKLSKFMPHVSAYCKVCEEKYNVQAVEDVSHAILHCRNIQIFWEKLCKVLKCVTKEQHVTAQQKLFGWNENYLANVLVQVAHRAIWKTRISYEIKNRLSDIWPYFKRKLYVITYRAFMLLNRKDFEFLFVTNNGIVRAYTNDIKFIELLE